MSKKTEMKTPSDTEILDWLEANAGQHEISFRPTQLCRNLLTRRPYTIKAHWRRSFGGHGKDNHFLTLRKAVATFIRNPELLKKPAS